jgi:hypothetical protein
MKHTETDDIFRLYVREWVVVQTFDMQADDGRELFEQARTWVAGNLNGRVYDKDVRLTMFTDLQSRFWCHVEVFKDNLRGEFKHHSLAEQFARSNDFDEYTIVPRNSAADHNIRNYGVVKL